MQPKHLLIKVMGLEKDPRVFLDVSIDGDPVERIVIQVMREREILLFTVSLACFLFGTIVDFSLMDSYEFTLLKWCSFLPM